MKLMTVATIVLFVVLIGVVLFLAGVFTPQIRIYGTVSNGSVFPNTPISGATIIVRAGGTIWSGGYSMPAPVSTSSDSNGNFTISRPNVSNDNTYTVDFSKAGFRGCEMLVLGGQDSRILVQLFKGDDTAPPTSCSTTGSLTP